MLAAGEVAVSDPVDRIDGEDDRPTVVDLMDVWYDVEPDPRLLERLLASLLAERARPDVERMLSRALAGV